MRVYKVCKINNFETCNHVKDLHDWLWNWEVLGEEQRKSVAAARDRLAKNPTPGRLMRLQKALLQAQFGAKVTSFGYIPEITDMLNSNPIKNALRDHPGCLPDVSKLLDPYPAYVRLISAKTLPDDLVPDWAYYCEHTTVTTRATRVASMLG